MGRHHAFLILGILISNANTLLAAELPPGFRETLLTDQLKDPTRIRFAPDGRLFILEQGGTVRILKKGVLLSNPALQLEVDSRGEHGLLGIEFDPNFESNHWVYIYYSALAPEVHNRISRFEVREDEILKDSETILIDLPPTGSSIFHSAGDIRIHRDGKMYIGVGDNANRRNAQNLTNPFGKILRFNRDGTIPEDNPFYSSTTGIGRAIWAYGFRNPFSFQFQQGTDRLFINDVGAETWEEINEGQIGGNYGWPLSEGPSERQDLIPPIYAYHHGPLGSEDEGCAITGGTFYPHLESGQSQAFPNQFQGQYFFFDYCNAWIKTLNPLDHTVATFGKGLAPNPVGLIASNDGSLYYLSRWNHGLYSIHFGN